MANNEWQFDPEAMKKYYNDTYGGAYASGNKQTDITASWSDKYLEDVNGGKTKIDGYGADVVNGLGSIGNLFMTNKAIKADQAQSDRQWNFMDNESKKNWAMKMNEWRSFENSKARSNAQFAAYRDEGGRNLRGDEVDQFLDSSQRVDRFGNVQADPFTVGPNGNVTTPGTNIAGSAFAQKAPAPVNPVSRLASRTTTTPQQVAGLPGPRTTGPHDKQRKREQKEVNKVVA